MFNSMFSTFRSSSKNTANEPKKRRRLRENRETFVTDVLQITPPQKRAKQNKPDKLVQETSSPVEVFRGWFNKAMSWADRYNAWNYVVGRKNNQEKPKTVITIDDNEDNVKKLVDRKQGKRTHPEVVIIDGDDDIPQQIEQTAVSRKEVIVIDSPEKLTSIRIPPDSYGETSTPLRPPDEFVRGYKPILTLKQNKEIQGNPNEIVKHGNMTKTRTTAPQYHKAPQVSLQQQKPTLLTEPTTNMSSDTKSIPLSQSPYNSFTVGKHPPASGKVRIRPMKETTRRHILSKRHKSTAREVVRLDEKHRYLQLLSQYTSSSLPLEADRKGKENHSILTSKYEQADCSLVFTKPPISQRKVVRKPDQSILSPRSSLLPSHSSHSTPLSPVPQPTVVKVTPSLNRTHHPTKRNEDLSVFSRTAVLESDKSSISASTTRIHPRDSLLGDDWTKKWRTLLSQENLSRERENAKIQREEKRLEELRAKRREELLAAVDEARLRREEEEESEEEEDASEFVTLTDEMEREIDRALGPGNPSETLVDGGKVSVTRADMVTLSNLNWLNDEVINFYFHLVMERSKSPGYLKVHSFNSFFYPKLIKSGYDSLKRWTRRVDIFKFDIILVPIHLGMHWCVAAIDFRNKTIRYFDSLKGSNPQCLDALKKYLNQESMDKKKTPYDTSNWSLSSPKDIPEQLNGCDCGVFACKYAEYISRDKSFTFDQRNMPYFRRRMVYEILKMKLL